MLPDQRRLLSDIPQGVDDSCKVPAHLAHALILIEKGEGRKLTG
jgi:hypothetical protein